MDSKHSCGTVRFVLLTAQSFPIFDRSWCQRALPLLIDIYSVFDTASGAGDAMQTSGNGSIMVSVKCAVPLQLQSLIHFYRSTSSMCAVWRFKMQTPAMQPHNSHHTHSANGLGAAAAILAADAGELPMAPIHSLQNQSNY